MRKALLLLMAVVIGLASTAQADERFTPAKRHRHCRYESWNNKQGFTDYEAKLTIKCAVDHFPTSLSTALYVANRESGFECKADNPISSAAGVFQTLDSTWASWWPSHSRFLNARHWKLKNNVKACRANIMVSIRQAHQGGWAPWGY